jgi:hypothetical protein
MLWNFFNASLVRTKSCLGKSLRINSLDLSDCNSDRSQVVLRIWQRAELCSCRSRIRLSCFDLSNAIRTHFLNRRTVCQSFSPYKEHKLNSENIDRHLFTCCRCSSNARNTASSSSNSAKVRVISSTKALQHS